MRRALYLVYFWLIVVPIFLVLTILTALTTIVGCLLGGERIFSYYPGMIWSRLTCYLALCPVTVKGRAHIKRGRSYVFVQGKNGRLEKRYVTVGKSLWGSYTEIRSGLSETDYIAFPYGKNVKEGAPTVEGDRNDLYNY